MSRVRRSLAAAMVSNAEVNLHDPAKGSSLDLTFTTTWVLFYALFLSFKAGLSINEESWPFFSFGPLLNCLFDRILVSSLKRR
jgi:hypothetical protein